MTHTTTPAPFRACYLAILVALILPISQAVAKDPDKKASTPPPKPAVEIKADYLVYGTGATHTQTGKDPYAAGGIIRLMANWMLIENENNDTGQFVFKVEHRHRYTDTSPKAFVINNIGAVGLILPSLSDQGLRLTNLYWKQQFNQQDTELLVGFLDTTDYIDTYALGNPWNGFSNFIFSTGAGTLAMPDEASLGISVRHMFSQQLYGLASLSDGNADSSHPFEGVSNLIDEHELFSSLELGWVESLNQFYTRNIHATAWHLDGGTRHGQQDSQGINISATYMVDQWIPFFRAGYAEGDASLLSGSITAGIGYVGLGSGQDSLNLALAWGQPNKALFNTQFDDQYTAEIFYKYRLNDHLTISPNVQYIKTLPFNPTADDSWEMGLRAYFTL